MPLNQCLLYNIDYVKLQLSFYVVDLLMVTVSGGRRHLAIVCKNLKVMERNQQDYIPCYNTTGVYR